MYTFDGFYVYIKMNTIDKIAQHNTSSGTIIVIVDDDPTGYQTTHGVKVSTSWEAEKVNAEIISRSDSTLRGHFFVESKILIGLLGPFGGLIFISFFKEGGRVTKEYTHFVLQDENCIPAHETEFAKDPLFPFQNSHLPSYNRGKISWFLEDIRSGGAELVAEKLMQTENNRTVYNVKSTCFSGALCRSCTQRLLSGRKNI